MALIEEALKQILSDDADVSALVGNRIHPGFLLERATYPAVAFRKVDAELEPVLDTDSKGGPARKRFAFFSVAKEPTADMSARKVALTVDKAVRKALHGFKDVVIVEALSPPEMIDVLGIFFVTASDTYEDRTQTHQCLSLYDVHHAEEVS